MFYWFVFRFMEDFTEDQLMDLYGWIDSIPLSKKKRNLARDFSDGVLMAEVVNHFFPRMVDLYNYQQGLRVDTKIYNWKHLNEKVLKKINFKLDTNTINALANSTPMVIEHVLWNFRELVNKVKSKEQKPYFIDSDDEDEIPENIAQFQKSKVNEDRQLLEQKIQECEEQEQFIEMLQQKIEKLEALNKLKDAKIAKLERQLNKR